MKHYIDLLSILTPKHLRQGLEHRSRFLCGDFEINIFETFESSTAVQIQYEGLSISGMIRGFKTVHTQDQQSFTFEPGTSLILPEGETIYADFPEANSNKPVQCATILIPSEKLSTQLATLDILYPQKKGQWHIDFKHFHFNNNSAVARSFNELLQLTNLSEQNETLNDLLLKTFLVRIIEAQQSHVAEQQFLQLNDQLYQVKNYIKDHLCDDVTIEDLMKVGNCSKRTLYRLFEQFCNRSPNDYLVYERMALARNLLLNPNNNIAGVTYQCGFSSVSYFSKIFKAHNHCTPKEFIAKFRV